MSGVVIKTFHSGIIEITNQDKKRWKYDREALRWYYWIGPGGGKGFWSEIKEPPNYIKDKVFERIANKGKGKKKDRNKPGFWQKTFGSSDDGGTNDVAEEVPAAPGGFPGGGLYRGASQVPGPITHYKQDFSTKGYQGPAISKCKHWRVPIAIGEHKVFVSAQRSCPTDLKDVPFAGLYLDTSWKNIVQPTALSAGTTVPGLGARYDAIFLDWPDMAAFRDFPTLKVALEWLMTYARKGQMADIGCVGSHGRTGTALACLLVMEEGLTAEEAIKAVRKRHCKRCIETERQEAMIDSFYRFLRKQEKGA